MFFPGLIYKEMVQQKIDSTNVASESEFRNYEIISKSEIDQNVAYQNFIFRKDKDNCYIIKKEIF